MNSVELNDKELISLIPSLKNEASEYVEDTLHKFFLKNYYRKFITSKAAIKFYLEVLCFRLDVKDTIINLSNSVVDPKELTGSPLFQYNNDVLGIESDAGKGIGLDSIFNVFKPDDMSREDTIKNLKLKIKTLEMLIERDNHQEYEVTNLDTNSIDDVD